MSLSLKERFERQGAVRELNRVRDGSPADVGLSVASDVPAIRTVTAALTLAKRHVPMLRAKRAIEAVVRDGSVRLDVPKVEDLSAFSAELRDAGVTLRLVACYGVEVVPLPTKAATSREVLSL
jgi:hypothetical protein